MSQERRSHDWTTLPVSHSLISSCFLCANPCGSDTRKRAREAREAALAAPFPRALSLPPPSRLLLLPLLLQLARPPPTPRSPLRRKISISTRPSRFWPSARSWLVAPLRGLYRQPGAWPSRERRGRTASCKEYVLWLCS